MGVGPWQDPTDQKEKVLGEFSAPGVPSGAGMGILCPFPGCSKGIPASRWDRKHQEKGLFLIF